MKLVTNIIASIGGGSSAHGGSGSIGAPAGGIGVHAARGGYISSAGTSTSDSIAAMLSNGEYVTKSAAVSYYGKNFFDGLNNFSIPKHSFSDGGFASPMVAPVVSGNNYSTASADDNRSYQVTIQIPPQGGGESYNSNPHNRSGSQIGSEAAKAFLKIIERDK